MRYLFIFTFLSATFWACQPQEACISSATNRLVVDFFVDTLLLAGPGLVQDTLGIRQVRSQTAKQPFLNRTSDSLVRRLFLRLDPDKDTSTFFFEGTFNRQAFSHSLVLRYQRRYRLISPDCPLEVSFEQLSVVSTTFDSVRVINTELREPSTDTDIQIIRPQLQ